MRRLLLATLILGFFCSHAWALGRHGSSGDLRGGIPASKTCHAGEYLESNKLVVREQLLKAGVRLARLLDTALGN
jgi:hypothetical protein